MDLVPRIECSLESALAPLTGPDCPAGLARAIRAALFPGGARIRPKLVLAVADACGAGDAPLVDRAAAAIEFLHCASLVQDDLVCFDDAATRRGQPALHVAFDERLAILASDALIVAAFDLVAVPAAADTVFDPVSERAGDDGAARLALVSLLSRRIGSRGGITAGQAWESESDIDLEAYHRAKTGALFAAACEAGALAAGWTSPRAGDVHGKARGETTGGRDTSGWRRTGECIGAAYQIADDLHDVLGCPDAMGKPVSVDAAHHRPNAAMRLGVDGASARLGQLIEEIVDTVPDCPHAARLVGTIRHEAMRFLPKGLGTRTGAPVKEPALDAA